jgi:hypothetical protein
MVTSIVTVQNVRLANCHHKTQRWIADTVSCHWTQSSDHSMNIWFSQASYLGSILILPFYTLIIGLPGGFLATFLNVFLTISILAARCDHSPQNLDYPVFTRLSVQPQKLLVLKYPTHNLLTSLLLFQALP